MSQGRYLKSSLYIALIAAFISCGICCNDLEWKCSSGDCIALEELCDGKKDCADGSDEKADSCIQQNCPTYAYQCAYGACVIGSAKCNGVQDCADNSDEAGCDADFTKKKSTCSVEQFACASGQCIPQDIACDGKIDCSDESDETVAACTSNTCPSFAFRCGYGACIGEDKKCDGKADCADASDEVSIICGNVPTKVTTTTSTRKPPISQRPPPRSGCKAPNIKNSRLVLESNESVEIKPGETVPVHIAILYKCIPGYNRIGLEYNTCTASGWRSSVSVECFKFCDGEMLRAVTFKAECEFQGSTVPCYKPVRPGTRATIICRPKYVKPIRVGGQINDVLFCQDDGQWDYYPVRCEQVCGEEPPKVQGFVVNGVLRNITEVPWHVGIFVRHSQTYQHQCGGTIISAKVVISAAHCFWDFANEIVFDKSLFSVGAGKYFRDYYSTAEQGAQFQNISEIAIPLEYRDREDNYRADIAVLVLTNFLRFTAVVAPICLEWQYGGAKSIESGVNGRVAGWGKDNSGTYSSELHSIEVQSTSLRECTQIVGPKYANSVANDKFCVINTSKSVACAGDSGGGFAAKKEVGNRLVYYLWGMVSNGVPINVNCGDTLSVSFTNIQYYEQLINERLNNNRVK